MEEKELLYILKTGAKELGVEIEEPALRSFFVYLKELKKWNEKINLTSLRSDYDIVTKHFLDSLTPVRFLKETSTLLDIGTGAGFPGIPIKLVMPRIKVTLIEGVGKKVHFLRHIIRTLGLKDIEAIWARAEDAAVKENLKASFDCVISRALSRIDEFIKLSRPYLKENGVIIGMKGRFGQRLKKELAGFSRCESHEIRVPFTESKTSIVIFRNPLDQ